MITLSKRLGPVSLLLLLAACGTYNGTAATPDLLHGTPVAVAQAAPRPFCTPGGPNEVDTASQSTICGRVFFAPASDNLTPDALQTLRAQAYFIEKNRASLDASGLVLASRCDEDNLDDNTLALGERRAKAVRKYFMGSGIPADMIRIVRCNRNRPFMRGNGASAHEADGSVDLSVCLQNGQCIEPNT